VHVCVCVCVYVLGVNEFEVMLLISLIYFYCGNIQATTDLYGKCTTRHSGTSAAAPEAAAIFALALEAK